MDRRFFLKSGLAVGAAVVISRAGLSAGPNSGGSAVAGDKPCGIEKVSRTDEEWKQALTPEQYRITRQKGTEAPYTSPLNDVHDKGIFQCVACSLPLFSSATKFDSHTGWPSFYAPISKCNVSEKEDGSLGMTRTEVLCARCDSHLGHVFDDGPEPTGLRYCMNGVALKFEKSSAKGKHA